MMSAHGADEDSLLACIDHWSEYGQWFAGVHVRDRATAERDAETLRRGVAALDEVKALREENARLRALVRAVADAESMACAVDRGECEESKADVEMERAIVACVEAAKERK